MPYQIVLQEDDFLTYQLFASSRTKRVVNQRRKSWLIMMMMFGVLSVLFYQSNNSYVGFYFLIIAVITLVFYPTYSGWRYKKHYHNFVQETYRNRFNKQVHLVFSDGFILIEDESSESKLKITEIEEITEIRTHLFIRLRSGETLIIPKNKTESMVRLQTELKLLSLEYNLTFTQVLDWRWK